MASTEIKLVEQLVLVHDPIIGSKYELQLVEVEVEIEAPENEQ